MSGSEDKAGQGRKILPSSSDVAVREERLGVPRRHCPMNCWWKGTRRLPIEAILQREEKRREESADS